MARRRLPWVCVSRDGVRLCVRVVLMCCNDMAYALLLIVGGRRYRGFGVYKDGPSQDYIVWEDTVEDAVSQELLEDMLTEAFAKIDAMLAGLI